MTPPRSTAEKRNFIEDTLLELSEGRGSLSVMEDLRTLLLQDREARLIYLQNNQLDCLLESIDERKESLEPISKGSFARRRRLYIAAGAGLAAAILALAIFGPLANPLQPFPTSGDTPTEQSVASLRSDYNAVISGNPAVPSQPIGEGDFALQHGIAQLAFRNGTQIVLEGNCGFEIIDEMSVVLTHGKMWAYCPEQAHGFKVLTPGGREIIDLGTEFGIEVTSSGATDVHVFDGLVDVLSPEAGLQRVSAGSALHWPTADGPGKVTNAEPGKFVSADSLASKRYLAYRQYIASRDDLLLYYDFDQPNGRRCLNTAANPSDQSHGRIRGTTSVHGRCDGSKALQFENTGDRVELKMNRFDSLPGFTAAAWLKVDRFDSEYLTILNSNNWEPGAIHFQIDQQGRIKSGINGGPSFKSNSGYLSPGQWHFVAVSWNFDTKEAQLFCDGHPVPTRPGPPSSPRSTFDPQLGACQIGAWNETHEYWSQRKLKQPRNTREFRGRIDEVMIFNHPLSEKEVADLSSAGTP